MSRKLRVLGIGLLALVATASFAAVTASANKEGHVVTAEAEVALVYGTEEGAVHKLEYIVHGLENGVICDKQLNFAIQTEKETEEDISLFPSYADCHTTGSAAGTSTIKANGCGYILYIAKNTDEKTEQTMDLLCSTPLKIEHPNCKVTVPEQKELSGITYTKILLGGVHAITADFKVQVNVQLHEGLCVFLGTNRTGTINGSITIEAFNLSKARVPLTAT